jgi:uncharacterized repeat protein (TIGR03803 family)
MNSIKLLIGVAVLFLVALSAQAQSMLEGLIFESAIASSILEDQVGSDVSMAGALLCWNASIGGNNTVFEQASIAPDAGQTRQLEFTSEFNNNGSTGSELDEMSFRSVTATPEPSSLLLFGVGGSAVWFYKTFTGTNDGAQPVAGLAQGSDGYLYGTTEYGGTNRLGAVFKISTNGAPNSLYSFSGGNDGANPSAALVQGTDGDFYVPGRVRPRRCGVCRR